MGDFYLEAAVFLDNTSGRTAAAGGGNKLIDGNDWFGYSFQTPTFFEDTNYIAGHNYFRTLSGLFCTTNDSGNYTVDVRLYSATLGGGKYKPDTLLASTTATLSGVSTTPAYYNIDLPLSSVWTTDWNVEEGNNYYSIVIGNGTYVGGGVDSVIKWAGIDTFEPANGSGYLIHENWVDSGNGGSGWSGASPSDRPGLYLTSAAVPEPHEYALMAGLGLIGFGIWRRRMKGTTSASA